MTQMAAWLYQMTANDDEPWGPEEYRIEVWQGQTVTWPVGKLSSSDGRSPSPGDIIILFFAKSNNAEPGVYGWGIVSAFIERKPRSRVKFLPTPPSDYLKMAPLWNDGIDKLINEIRGGFNQGTMWQMTVEQLNVVRLHIQQMAKN